MRSSGAIPPGAPSATRTDIQALRAFAVLGVVLFHLWPNALTGGYVGVDVFFVISGFLITGQLMRARDRGSLRLSSFWAARARRLLPVSLFVLLVSVVLTLVWAPAVVQGQYLRSILSSALYVGNWQLAADGVDYLAQDNAPPIAQHYWSLSAEEQFYILWPLLIIALTWGVRRSLAAKHRTVLAAVAVIAVCGFVASVILTGTSYPYGYFSTPSRIWEFAIGAVVALMPRALMPRAAHLAVWCAALVALIVTVFVYDSATPFPGPAAALPVVATAALIAVGPDAPTRALGKLVGWRPLQWIGDQSYGIYLWHWPLVVIAPAVLGRPPELPENLLLLVMSFVLAAITKRFIEDPIRFGAPIRRQPSWRILAATAVAMAVVVTACVVPIRVQDRAEQEQQAALDTQITDPAACRGASVLLQADCAADSGTVEASDLVPTLAGLAEDTDGAYDCYDYDPTAGNDPQSCTFGSDDPDALRIMLNGDSHAAMLIPALREQADSHNWSVDTFVGRGCTWSEPALGGCEARNDKLTQRVADGEYDVLLVTALNSPDWDQDQRDAIAAGYTAAWRAAAEEGTTVIVLADNPNVPQSAQDCVANATSFALDTCAFSPAEGGTDHDPLRVAAEQSGATLIDFTAAYCTDDLCPMVLGGVVVYRDLHHITATFSRSLGPYLADELEDGAAAAMISSRRSAR